MGMWGGAQSIIDSVLTVAGTGLPVYYRMYNFDPATVEAQDELGFSKTVAAGQGGTTDIQIFPQPRTKNLSMHQISEIPEKLDETSRYFVISHSFVEQMMMANPDIPEQEYVFDGWKKFVGIYYEQTLYKIVQYAHSEIGGSTVSWRLTCTAIKLQ